METKFTKGKWILNEGRLEIVSENDCSKNGGIDIIAQCFCGFNTENTNEEAKANANLIAAAPELFDACIKMVKYFDSNNLSQCDAYYQLKKVIKKATE